MHSSNCTPLPQTESSRVVASSPPQSGNTACTQSWEQSTASCIVLCTFCTLQVACHPRHVSASDMVLSQSIVKSTCSHRSSKQQDLAYLVREHGHTDVTNKACTFQVIMIGKMRGVAAYFWKLHGSIFACGVGFQGASSSASPFFANVIEIVFFHTAQLLQHSCGISMWKGSFGCNT